MAHAAAKSSGGWGEISKCLRPEGRSGVRGGGRERIRNFGVAAAAKMRCGGFMLSGRWMGGAPGV